ncbi:MAG: pyridoxamine 5'-phosphate oxidase [Candidatus Hydrogenedentes bacterium]|nr:pyridoxamine 5'-phosphate oxidase [Candidatus Hydrogenedentota bacterium]
MSIRTEPDPIVLFEEWCAEAHSCKAIAEPTAMTLATVDDSGMPAARVVLLKAYDGRGFVFYTNLSSPKVRQLDANPKAALCFYWMPLDKQIRVQGLVERVTDAEADAYFATRPRQSQIGAWASKQSQPYTERLELEKRLLKYTAKFGLGAVPRPPFWSGFRVVPETIEFWLKQPFRLHDRVLYTRHEDVWTRTRVFP